MDELTLREYLSYGERDWLDFKRDAYGDLKSAQSRNELIKDILAMANTPRDRSAVLILGVSWTAENGSEIIGLERHLDDQQFQTSFGTDRAQPIPRFTYTPFNLDGKNIGTIEILLDDRGPFTPIKDFDGLQAGAIYFRRGTTSERAVGDEIAMIVRWFQNGENHISPSLPTDNWRPFLEAVRNFSPTTAYILITDRTDEKLAGIAHAIGAAPWRAVIDFDPLSDIDGLLKICSGVLEKNRTVHRAVRGDYVIRPEPGLHWFFARGIQGRNETISNADHRGWLKQYKTEISRQLQSIASAVSPTPVIAVVIWEDAELKKHLRTILEDMSGAFGEFLETVFVSNDKVGLESISDDAGATFIKMSRRSLSSSLAVHFADKENSQNDERFVLDTPSGALIELSLPDQLWLCEDLEILHRNTGMSGEDEPENFRRGADVSWRDLNLHHDCDRDCLPQIRAQVEDDLRRRQTVRINLYHAPGGGGSTLGRRIAWDLHRIYPTCILKTSAARETSEKIAKLSALTECTILVVIDGGQHSERDIDELYGYLKASQTPAVLLQVLRRFNSQQPAKRRFWLNDQLSNQESDRFKSAYIRAAPTRSTEIQRLASSRNERERTAFFFGLTAFEKDFRGLTPYVSIRIEHLNPEQSKILGFLAIANYYGQQAVPAHAFAKSLGLPQSKPVDIRSIFTGENQKTLDLLIEAQPGHWRTSHPLISLEVMRLMLSPPQGGAQDGIWRQNLSKWSKDLADLCSGDGDTPSDILLELARRVFIYRDNVEVLGTERSGSRGFSQLIDDIPSDAGRVEVLRHLTECFPMEAHMHAHLGRFLGAKGDFDQSIHEIDYAISLQNDDHVLHHMRGMVLRQKMKSSAERGASIDELVELSIDSSSSFERTRDIAPELEHGYISEIQLLLELVDRAKISNITSASSHPYLREALDRAEDILDRLQYLYAGEEPSRYALDCQAKLSRLHGDFSKSLQGWDNLLSRPEIPKPPVRRQIVWTILRKHQGRWENLSSKEINRVKTLLEENLEENSNDSTSLRLWLRAVRYSASPPSLDALTEKVGYWKVNTGTLDSAFYLYTIHFLRILQGSSQAVIDTERALEECRSLTRFRRDRTRSFEWIGEKNGIQGLIHQSQLGDWKGEFFESTDLLRRVSGRIKTIDGPQKGLIEISGGIEAFFVPAKSDIHAGKDENALVTFYLGLSYDGPRAWDVTLG